jgi:hypothetical protein
MKSITPTLRTNRILSLITFLLGVILIIYMITVEGELGALPLALTLLGAIWSMVVNYKIKTRSNR